MWFIRRMQKIPWTAKRTNESVLMEVNKNATLVNKIGTQQARFTGHKRRRHSLEQRLTTGKIEWKRARGRQREKILDSIARWLGQSKKIDIMKHVEDRRVWQRNNLQRQSARNLKKRNQTNTSQIS